MVVPLALGSVITTFAPNTAQVFGSFTGALFTGAIPLIAVFFICLGSTISARALPRMLKRGGVMTMAKVGVGILIGYVLGHTIGVQPIQSGWLAGISTLAVVAAFNASFLDIGQFGHGSFSICTCGHDASAVDDRVLQAGLGDLPSLLKAVHRRLPHEPGCSTCSR